MAELSAKAGKPTDIGSDGSGPEPAPPLVPADPAIDRAHLGRMTQGDRALERDVLGLFVAQAEILLGRMRGATPAAAGALAHTLSGSARGIGAWEVADAAAVVEAGAAAGGDVTVAVERLAAAVRAAQAAIAELVRD